MMMNAMMSSNKNFFWILRNFSCPLREEEFGCRYEQSPERCCFGHPTARNFRSASETSNDSNFDSEESSSSSSSSSSSLLPLPPFICLRFLKTNGHVQCRRTNNSQFGGSYCESGLHIKAADIGPDPSKFEELNQPLLKQLFGPDIGLECRICLEKVLAKRSVRNRRFGLLENCQHVFCGRCLEEWHRMTNVCPVCRVESSRYLVRAKFVHNLDEKRDLFRKTVAAGFILGGGDASRQYVTSITSRAIRLPEPPSSYLVSPEADGPGPWTVPITSTIDQHDLYCRICREKVLMKSLVRRAQFALLENCSHVFCSYCIIDNRTSLPSFRCPICRTESRRFSISEHFISGQDDPKTKRGRFAMQKYSDNYRVYNFGDGNRNVGQRPGYLDNDYFHYCDGQLELNRRPSAVVVLRRSWPGLSPPPPPSMKHYYEVPQSAIEWSDRIIKFRKQLQFR